MKKYLFKDLPYNIQKLIIDRERTYIEGDYYYLFDSNNDAIKSHIEDTIYNITGNLCTVEFINDYTIKIICNGLPKNRAYALETVYNAMLKEHYNDYFSDNNISQWLQEDNAENCDRRWLIDGTEV